MPLGYDDGFGESLSSMYRRVAAVAVRSPREVVREACASVGLAVPNLDVYGEDINGHNWVARNLTTALAHLSGCADLRRANLLDARLSSSDATSLLRRGRAWCPLCIAEGETHAPLLWSFRAYTVCVRHECLMGSRCNDCKRAEIALMGRSTPTHCGRCGYSLARAKIVHRVVDPNTSAVTEAVRAYQAGDDSALARFRRSPIAAGRTHHVHTVI